MGPHFSGDRLGEVAFVENPLSIPRDQPQGRTVILVSQPISLDRRLGQRFQIQGATCLGMVQHCDRAPHSERALIGHGETTLGQFDHRHE